MTTTESESESLRAKLEKYWLIEKFNPHEISMFDENENKLFSNFFNLTKKV